MKNFIHFRYVYSFYSDGELTLEDIFDERFEVSEGCRFTIHDQEDGSFLVSEIKDTAEGKSHGKSRRHLQKGVANVAICQIN